MLLSPSYTIATYNLLSSELFVHYTLLLLQVRSRRSRYPRDLISGSEFYKSRRRYQHLTFKVHLIQLTINGGATELARRYPVLEQQVDLPESTVLGLRNSEPAPSKADEVGSGVKEGGFGAPIPSGCRDHPRRDGVGDDTCDVVDDSLHVA